MSDVNPETICQIEDAAAYLDGELDDAAATRFETHLKSCAGCADELRAQRQLLCTLNVAFNDSRSFALPLDFTRIVTTRAESDLSGMRKRPERRRAVKLCALLALVSFALMGAASRAIVFDPLRSFMRATASLLDLCWEAATSVAASAAVLVRVMGHAFFVSQNGLGLAVVLLLLLSVCFLLILIARYHRAQTVE